MIKNTYSFIYIYIYIYILIYLEFPINSTEFESAKITLLFHYLNFFLKYYKALCTQLYKISNIYI
jgi:hypothetical protein